MTYLLESVAGPATMMPSRVALARGVSWTRKSGKWWSAEGSTSRSRC